MSNQDRIEVGATVELKSGGPAMTVASIKEGTAKCMWFLDGVQKVGGFPLPALKTITFGGFL